MMTTEQRETLSDFVTALRHVEAGWRDDYTCRPGDAEVFADAIQAALIALAVAERRAEARGKALEWFRGQLVQVRFGRRSCVTARGSLRGAEPDVWYRDVATISEVDVADLAGGEHEAEGDDEKRITAWLLERAAQIR